MRATFSFMLRPATNPRWLECTSRATNFDPLRHHVVDDVAEGHGPKTSQVRRGVACAPTHTRRGLGDKHKERLVEVGRIAWRYELKTSFAPESGDEDVARALRPLCRSQVIADLEADLAKTDSEGEARALRKRVARFFSVFSERSRRIEGIAVRDPAIGEIHSDLEWVGEISAPHWVPIFAGAPAPWRAAMRPFLAECSRLQVGEVVEPISLE